MKPTDFLLHSANKAHFLINKGGAKRCFITRAERDRKMIWDAYYSCLSLIILVHLIAVLSTGIQYLCEHVLSQFNGHIFASMDECSCFVIYLQRYVWKVHINLRLIFLEKVETDYTSFIDTFHFLALPFSRFVFVCTLLYSVEALALL